MFKFICAGLVSLAILATGGAAAAVGAVAIAAGEAALPAIGLTLAGILGLGAAANRQE